MQKQDTLKSKTPEATHISDEKMRMLKGGASNSCSGPRGGDKRKKPTSN